jgi:hypothetical protein
LSLLDNGNKFRRFIRVVELPVKLAIAELLALYKLINSIIELILRDQPLLINVDFAFCITDLVISVLIIQPFLESIIIHHLLIISTLFYF